MGLKPLLFLAAVPALFALDTNTFADDKMEQRHLANLVDGAASADSNGVEVSESLRISASSLRKIDQIGQFIAQYAARSLKGRWKGESRRIASAIVEMGSRHGIDPLLILAVIENESRFNPEIVGAHGEIGLMQIKPDTAEWIAKKSQIEWNGADTLRDPVANIQLGATYLSMLRTKYSADKDLYLAAYNMGVKHLSRVLNNKARPRVYPQKTHKHYSRIYFEFIQKREAARTTAGSFAGV